MGYSVKYSRSKFRLAFGVKRIKTYFGKMLPKHRISKYCHIYLAGVMEYLAAEVLYPASKIAKMHGKYRITPRHIFLAIANDQDLYHLLKNVIIPQGGVVPHILPQLLPKPKNKVKGHQSASSHSTVRNITVSNLVDPHKFFPGISVLIEKKLPLGQKVALIQGDILSIKVDALILPTDSFFSLSDQIGQRLLAIGGDRLKLMIAQVKSENGPLNAYDAVLSLSHNTTAKYIIYCNNPMLNGENATMKLEATLLNCLKVADSRRLNSLAVPLIGIRSPGISVEVAAEVHLKTVFQYMSVTPSSLDQLYLVVLDGENVKIVVKLFNRMHPGIFE